MAMIETVAGPVHGEDLGYMLPDTVKHLDYSLEVLRQGAWVQYDCLMAGKIGGSRVRPELDRRHRRGMAGRLLRRQSAPRTHG